MAASGPSTTGLRAAAPSSVAAAGRYQGYCSSSSSSSSFGPSCCSCSGSYPGSGAASSSSSISSASASAAARETGHHRAYVSYERRNHRPTRPWALLCRSSSSSSSSTSSSSSPFMGAAAGVGAQLGSAFRAAVKRAGGGFQQLPLSLAAAAARSAWKQEVLWAESPVAEIEKAAESLFHVALDVSDNQELIEGHTRPGQFVQVKVGNTKPAFLAIASPPSLARKGRLEFLIKDPGVEGSTAGILCGLGKGDNVELSQVLGKGFKVEQLEPAEEYQTVLLFATGSGISPIRSLIESGFEAEKRYDVRLYYGARNLQRMAYQDKFKEWEASGVQIVPVLSQPDPDWGGAEGYVQASFSKNTGISNALKTGALLCGHKGMAEDVTGLLLADGVSKEKILLNF